MTTNTAARTPGYNCRLAIYFDTNKRDQRVAYYFSRQATRAIRMSLADAELFVATGQADLLPGHPFKASA